MVIFWGTVFEQITCFLRNRNTKEKIKENDFLIQIRVAKVGKWSKSLKKQNKAKRTLVESWESVHFFHLKFTTFNQFYDLQII